MKANTKKTNPSARRKLIPAVGMLTVSAMMLSSATYAWFTMNKEVEVTGMQFKTKVGANLLICTTNLDEDYSSDRLEEGVSALLEPVSSIDGTDGSFWYTVDAKGTGEKNRSVSDSPYIAYRESTDLANPTAGKIKYDKGFNSTYGVIAAEATPSGSQLTNAEAPAYGYVDYVFYIKANSDGNATTSAKQQIRMTQCDLQYAGGTSGSLKTSGTLGDDVDRAWRVAVFAKNVTGETNGAGKGMVTTNITGNGTADTYQKGLISLNGATYWEDKAVNGSGSTAAIVNKANSTGVIIGEIGTANATQYYKVVVRLWLEGADTSCNSKTYAALTNEYSLDLKFELDEGTAVNNISNNSFDPDIAATQSGSHKQADNVNY